MRNGYPKTVAKSEFTDYTVAGTIAGYIRAAALRGAYETDRCYIRTTRSLRRICRRTAIEKRVSTQQATRGGFPKRRERDPEAPSKRGVPKDLNQFKLIDRPNGEIRIFQLHATGGWKVFA